MFFLIFPFFGYSFSFLYVGTISNSPSETSSYGSLFMFGVEVVEDLELGPGIGSGRLAAAPWIGGPGGSEEWLCWGESGTISSTSGSNMSWTMKVASGLVGTSLWPSSSSSSSSVVAASSSSSSSSSVSSTQFNELKKQTLLSGWALRKLQCYRVIFYNCNKLMGCYSLKWRWVCPS